MGVVGLYSALSGLQAAQLGLEVTSDNIANASSPNHTRLSLLLASRATSRLPFGEVGRGVDVEGIVRNRDTFLDSRVRTHLAAFSHLDTRSEILGRMEAASGEPYQGMTGALDDLWNAFEDLANDPPSSATRTTVIAALEELTNRIRSTATAWNTMERDAAIELGHRVDELNDLVGQVAELNVMVSEAGDHPPPGLLDRRDALLDRMSELAGVTISDPGDGSARVSLNGTALVDQGTATSLTLDTGDYSVSVGSYDVEVAGLIAGYQSVLTTDLPSLRTALNDFTEELATELNAAHAAGYTPSGASGGPLLSFVAGAAADSVSVAISDPSDLAAAGSSAAAEYDGENAQALADLRTALVASGGSASLPDELRALVLSLGAAASNARTSTEAQAELAVAAEEARLNAHGVSLDEEMVMLSQYQRSYEAAARVISTIDEMMETLINLGR